MQKRIQVQSDQRETERDLKLRETVSQLKRMFTGVVGRVVDVCEPTSRRYDRAVSVLLGKHADSIIVDTEKTAMDCIDVCVFFSNLF